MLQRTPSFAERISAQRQLLLSSDWTIPSFVQHGPRYVDSSPGMAINFSEGKTSHLLTNSFWQFWISFGVSEISFVLLGATLMGQTIGGVVLAPAWTPLFVIAALTIGWANASSRRRFRPR